MKALIVNKIGDFGLYLAILLVFYFFKSFNFLSIFLLIPEFMSESLVFLGVNFLVCDVICFFLFVAAMGKSAQIFLHVWLPDAMEGPTPVSALIHAATMVTAGIFLVVRCSPLFATSYFTLTLMTLVGGLTAFVLAVVGLVQNDIKSVIAYSTCSQLGYMFLACGLGNYTVAMFHLFNHAFFKALLFLCAGSVIHSLHGEQDLRKMGSLWRFLPVTYVCMLIGTISITGLPFFSGFYSKDLILELCLFNGSLISCFAYILALCAIICTSYYSFRLLYFIFFGFCNIRGSVNSIQESGNLILSILGILAVFSLISGYLFFDLIVG